MEKRKWNSANLFFYDSINLKDILNYTDDEIYDKVFVLYADYETVVNNFDFFLRVVRIMMINGYNTINVDSYETVKFINDNLKDKMDIVLNVLDDYETKDRSEIIEAEIDKCKFTIPLSYIMWGIDFDNLMYVNVTSYHNNALNYNGNTSISLDTLKRVKDIIGYLKSLGRFSDLQIIILVSNYLQKNTEYLAENVDTYGEYIAKVDNPVEGLEDEVGLIETVLFKKYGLCTGIANSTTILLNNPAFKIDTRTIFNKGHALNITKYNGEYYFLDNTWNITRSKQEFEKAIKPVKFNSKYILYGKRTFEYAVDQEYLCDNPNISKVKSRGVRQAEILKAKRQMQDRVSFDYQGDIVHLITKIKR